MKTIKTISIKNLSIIFIFSLILTFSLSIGTTNKVYARGGGHYSSRSYISHSNYSNRSNSYKLSTSKPKLLKLYKYVNPFPKLKKNKKVIWYL